LRLVEPLEARCFLSVAISFDYSLDATGFFSSHPVAATALRAAADQLTSRLGDTLDAIQPGGGNSWTLRVTDPATGQTRDIVNPTIPADTIVVYAGSRSLGGPLGIGGPAGWSASGTSAFLDAVASRGEPGARGAASVQTDFAPAAGSITFDPLRSWNYDLTGPHAGTDDFVSVALHELGHVLGFGTANSWRNQVSGGVFNGDASVAVYGAPVPLSADAAHWAAGVSSDGQQAAMTPSLLTGTRKTFTRLDFAGLYDTGWEPAAAHVAAVYVSGSQWGQSFRDALAQQALGSAALGFDVTSAPTAPLPWSNLDRVSVNFDRDVALDAGDVVLSGTRGTIATTAFAYNPATRTATWTLAAPLGAERVLIDLNDPAIDGDNNGTPGGDFLLRFNVLPGDADRSGTVLANDFSDVKRKFFSSTTSPGTGAAAYSIFHDVNGSGSILADDFSIIKGRFFDTLPPGEPGDDAAALLRSPSRQSLRQAVPGA
jgi:hypothetical protein